VLALVEQPRVITGLVAQRNRITLQSYITGRPEAIATWHAENLHIYLVASLALVLAVPLKSLSQRIRIGSLALLVILGVTLALCVVQLKSLAEDYAQTYLGMTLYSYPERVFLHWADRALVLVGNLLLPTFLFLVSYLSFWSEARASPEARGGGSKGPQGGVGSWRTWGPLLAAIATLGAAGIFVAIPRPQPAHRSYLEGFQQVVALNPGSPKAYFGLALFYEEEGRLGEATDLYRKSLEMDPNLIVAHFNLGNVLFKQGDYGGAVQCYGEVLKREPEHTSARNNLGNTLFQQGLYDQAAEAYEGVLRLDEEHASTQKNLGLTLLRLDRPCDALQHLQRSASLDKSIAADSSLLSRIARLETRCGRK